MEGKLNFAVPCLFGLEGIAADELRRLGMDDVRAENGRVLFSGKALDVSRANINLATGERINILAGEAKADTFDMLFEAVRAMPWERYIPRDGAFPVTGHSLNSKLFSIPDCQKIIKKSIATRLTEKYGDEYHSESGAEYKIRFALMNDTVSMQIDTSGAGLHKRGYRPVSVQAPLRETLAAAMVRVARYRGRDMLWDPFCGSGTIPIEGALAAKNRAPGLFRDFAAQSWKNVDKNHWVNARDEAKSKEYSGEYEILGSDIDTKSIELAGANAERAGVSEIIRFQVEDARSFTPEKSSGIIISNPPYGERVMEREDAQKLYGEFGAATRSLKDWKLYILSSHTEFERSFGRKAVKKRKLYNGMIKCDLFMYY